MAIFKKGYTWVLLVFRGVTEKTIINDRWKLMCCDEFGMANMFSIECRSYVVL